MIKLAGASLLAFILSGCGELGLDKTVTAYSGAATFDPNRVSRFTGTTQEVDLIVEDNTLDQSRINNIVDVLNKVEPDFARSWNIHYHIQQQGGHVGNHLQIFVKQSIVKNLLTDVNGYHIGETTYIDFSETSKNTFQYNGISGDTTGKTINHELVEMLVDPDNNGREIADPVGGYYGVMGTETFTDFVTPAWYGDNIIILDGNGKQLYDIFGKLTSPGQSITGKNGYAR